MNENVKPLCCLCGRPVEVTDGSDPGKQVAHYTCQEKYLAPDILSTHHPLFVVPVSENDLDAGVLLATELHHRRDQVKEAQTVVAAVLADLCEARGRITDDRHSAATRAIHAAEGRLGALSALLLLGRKGGANG